MARRPVLTAADVGGEAALQALLAEGLAVHLWAGAALPVDVPSSPELRAQVLADDLPAHVVIGRQSAVWVHSERHRPEHVTGLVSPGRRRPTTGPHRTLHEATLRPQEVVVVGGVRVTSVLRTGLDVARWLDGPHRDAMLDSLVHRCGLDLDEALRRVAAAPGQRHTVRARAALESARRRAG